MAKPASSVVAVAGGFLLQGIAFAQPTCMNLTGTWYSHTMEGSAHQPMKVVQDGCSFTLTVPDMVLNGTAEVSSATLVIPGGEVGRSTSVASDGKEISWSWGDTWQRDCPGGLEGDYRVNGSDERAHILQNRCNLSFTFGHLKATGSIGEGLGIFELIEMSPYRKEVGKLVSKDSLTWNGFSFEVFRPTPCLDYNQFEPDTILEGHCEGDETNDPSEKESCLSKGCHWEGERGDDLCHCSSQKSCEGNGYTWKWRTCSDTVRHLSSHYGLNFSNVYDWAKRPELGGAVTGVYDRCFAEEEFRHSMAHMSNACCRDRMSVCDVKGQPKPTPCFRPADFEPEALVDGHCSGDETSDPARESWCRGMGCHWDESDESEDRCHCHEQAMCENNGFTWESRTCADHAAWLGPLPGLYLYEATEYGNITGAIDQCKKHEDFSGWMHRLSITCCRGRESICDIEGQPKPTPCFEPADFKPEALVDGHCIGDETSDPERESWCRGMGCYWDESDESEDRCHCHDQELCERNNFTWEHRTCADAALWLGPLPGLYLYKTTDYGKITGAMDKCKKDEGFSGMATWMKETCCGGKPSICDVGGASKCIKVPMRKYTNIVAKGGTLDPCKPEQ